jgi:hypothetical protein
MRLILNKEVNMNRIIYLSIILFIFLSFSLLAWDSASHIYLSREMKEIWEEFDPEFYNYLIQPEEVYAWEDIEAQMTQKFFYIGSIMPDMFIKEAQNTIQDVINALYDVRQDIPGWLVDFNHAYYIKNHTHNNIQSKILFDDPNDPNDPYDLEPNQNLEKIRAMAYYARDNNWSPYKKALIYGCYMHLIEDAIAHMILQPATFGYGRSIETHKFEEDVLLRSGEDFHELFTPTFINDWNWVKKIIFSGFKKDGSYYSTKRAFMQFYWQWTVLGTDYMGWQDCNFVPVQGFVEAANAVDYNIGNLSQERVEAYLHGWAIMLFIYMGYRWDGSDAGGIVGHHDWTLTDVLDFIYDIGSENVVIGADIPFIGDLIKFMLEEFLERTVLSLLGFVIEYCTGDKPWPSYFESYDDFVQLWNCVPPSSRPPDYEKYESSIISLGS